MRAMRAMRVTSLTQRLLPRAASNISTRVSFLLYSFQFAQRHSSQYFSNSLSLTWKSRSLTCMGSRNTVAKVLRRYLLRFVVISTLFTDPWVSGLDWGESPRSLCPVLHVILYAHGMFPNAITSHRSLRRILKWGTSETLRNWSTNTWTDYRGKCESWNAGLEAEVPHSLS